MIMHNPYSSFHYTTTFKDDNCNCIGVKKIKMHDEQILQTNGAAEIESMFYKEKSGLNSSTKMQLYKRVLPNSRISTLIHFWTPLTMLSCQLCSAPIVLVRYYF